MQELRRYETFETVKEMDNFICEALEFFDFVELDRKLLRLLAGYSCKFIGVSFLKVQTIADALEVSYKTAQRSLARLKRLGIIQRIRTIRVVSGGFGSSLNIIRPIELAYCKEDTEPAPERSQEVSEKKEAFSFKAFKKDIKYIRQQSEIDYSYLTEFVPSEFINTAKNFFNADEVFTLWGKVQAVSKKYASSVRDTLEPALRAFKASVMAYKMKRVKKSFGAYFWGALTGVFAVEQRKKLELNTILSWNWLIED